MDGHPDPRVKRIELLRGGFTWACPEVTLTRADMAKAYAHACDRHFDDVEAGRQSHYGEDRGPALGHVQGAVGESATAVYLELPWPNRLGDFKAADAGEGATAVQVRTVMRPMDPLKFYEWDEADAAKLAQPFCLALWEGRLQVVIVGWLYGHELIERGDWKPGTTNQSPHWATAQYVLRPVASLKARLLAILGLRGLQPPRGDGHGREGSAAGA